MNSESGLLVPEGARLVHIGPHKTGSTAIQVAMQQARPVLEEHGVYYATGPRHRPDKAGWALGLAGKPAGSERPPRQRWNGLVDKVTSAGEQRVCISNEDFGRATPEQLREIVSGFGSERVHVVAVARRLDRYLASQWQERVKAGDRRTFEDWLRVVLDGTARSWDRHNVWFAHDVDRLVRRWTKVVPADRFTLIVSDEVDRDLLPHTFEDLLGLPRTTLKPDPSRSNRGLSWSETELVRLVNEAIAHEGWSRPERRRFVKGGVLRDMGSRPAPAGPKSPPFPHWALDQLRELSDARVEQVRDLGVRVVGEAESMRMPAEVPVVDGPAVPPDVTPEVAAAAVAAVLRVALGSGGSDASEALLDGEEEEA